MTSVDKIVLMRKIIFCITVFIWHFSIAQSFTWKPSLGINYLVPGISNTDNKGGKPGFDVGFFSDITLHKKSFLELGFFYGRSNGKLQRAFIYPFSAPYLDVPMVDEKYTLNLIKVPISILFKQAKESPKFISVGSVIKYNISSRRSGSVPDRNETYSNRFNIDSKKGNSFGISLLVGVGREFKIKTQKFGIQINCDIDLTNWRYPTNFDLEEPTYYHFRSQNFSLFISYTIP